MSRTFEFAEVGKEGAGNTEVIQSDIAESEIEFEIRCRSDPARELLSEDEVVVGVAEERL